MSTVTATMETLDLSKAAHRAVEDRHVWKLQAMINVWLRSSELPPHEEPRPLLATDGIGGPLTRVEVVAFQIGFGLEPDAIVGPLTWRSLFEFDGVPRG
jgi:peptidoglycan hydrolase-like protein with peptidoglycan-binding domain